MQTQVAQIPNHVGKCKYQYHETLQNSMKLQTVKSKKADAVGKSIRMSQIALI